MADIQAVTSTRVLNTVLTNFSDNWIKNQPVEQNYKKNPFLRTIQKTSKLTIRGGGYYRVPVNAVDDGEADVVEKGSIIDLSDSDTVTAAEYRRVNYVRRCVLYDTDLQDCDTEKALFDIAALKLDNAKKSIENALSYDLWQQTQQTRNSLNAITGLPLHVEQDPTSGTLGGLGYSTHPFWVNQTITTSGVASSVLPGQMDEMEEKFSEEGGEVDFWVTTHNIHRILKKAARSYGTYELNKTGEKVADLGINAVMWNGKPVLPDYNCPAGFMYAINNGAMKLAVMPGCDFKVSEWENLLPAAQLGSVCVVKWTGALVTLERRLLGQISGLTES